MRVRPMLVGLLAAGMTLCGARVAGAQTPWLMDYLQGWYSDPAMVNAEQPTTVTLWGWFPYDCGQVTNATVVDSGHVELTLGEGPPCADTVRVWHQSFALGLLPAGYHTLGVRRTFYAQGSTTPEVASASFQFYVEASANPPPPPPAELPDLASVLVRCLSGWYTEPNPATDQAATTLWLWGWFPYYCGMTDAAVLGPGHVALMLRRGAACGDTTRTWSQSVDLGLLPQGEHTIRVDLTVFDDARATAGPSTATFTIPVGSEPVSTVAPNPFVEGTRFSVSQREAGRVRVDIYDVNGHRVTGLFDGELPAGTHAFRWAGRRADGERVPIGIYFSRVTMDRRVITRRLVLLPR